MTLFFFSGNFCWRGDYTYNSILNVCFKINYYNEDFSGARKACQADGGDLLTIKSLDMEVHLRPMLNENPSTMFLFHKHALCLYTVIMLYGLSNQQLFKCMGAGPFLPFFKGENFSNFLLPSL